MKFIRTFENFTEMDMGHQNMEAMCPDCQCNMDGCECGSPMAYEDDMEEGGESMPSRYERGANGEMSRHEVNLRYDGLDNDDDYDYDEEEEMMGDPMSSGMPSYFEEEDEMMGGEEEDEMMGGEEEDEMMPSGHRMGHIMSFQEAKKADKMTKKEKELAAKYPPKDKITRGDIITAAKENADKKKGGKEDKKESTKKGGKKEEEKGSPKKGGLSKSQEENLPEFLKKKIAPKSKK
jgi:hypothetical protein